MNFTEFPEITIRSGNAGNYIVIYPLEDIVVFDVVGAPSGADLISSITSGIEAGLVRPFSFVLVDVQAYTGSIDWGAVLEVSRMQDWHGGRQRQKPVAFVHGSGLFGFIAKIVSAMFRNSNFRVFPDRQQALDWLRMSQDESYG